MKSSVRIIAIMSACGIVNGFVGPTIPITPFLVKQGSSLSTRPHTSYQQSRHSQLHVLSEKDLADSPSLSSTDPNGAGSITMSSEDKIFSTAIRRTLACVAAAATFGTGLGFAFGSTTSEEFFAGYLLELSLSVDNLLVFLLLFEYFQVPMKYQNRVLNYGIIGAVMMRAIMIGAGAVAIHQFHAVLLVFAGILLFSSGKVLLGSDDDEEEDLADNAIIKLANNFIKSTPSFDGNKFFTVQDGVRLATPMLLCTIAVELSDVVFAVDSIPAVYGVTENPLVVFSSNMFAILGLRSLYTILSKAAEELEYLETSVAIILGFIGSKMIGEYFGFEVPTEVSLGVVFSLLAGGIGLSLWEQGKEEKES
ncbi:unnamed protein product [Cylindrotheca closterium]|uniref:Uncharacterized protein n=1 Tax=Cylindrotheca closterium TaxID=2856 RepID=A0AAD2FMP6_9STRA|nr:unnamed protein product [Cylindrotheca closterium]